MKKSAQVVMIPTNEKAVIGFLTQKGKERGHLVHFDRPMPNILDSENQHLYFLSDEEIKEGDYHVAIRIVKTNGHKAIAFTDQEQLDAIAEIGGAKKIIATTDKLNIHPNLADSYRSGNCLPQIPQSFIEHFVKEYNKGNVITEVMVEYEWNKTGRKIRKLDVFDHILKINPDNTIDINMPKDSWSREEVVELIQKYSKECTGWPWFETDEKWIEENL